MVISNKFVPITNTASAIPLSSYSLIEVSGTAATSFLQGQLTCDINLLSNKSSLAAHCNTKGRVRTLYRVFQQDTRFYLRCPKSLLKKALENLNFYARFSKVSLSPIENYVGFGIIVPITEIQSLPFPTLEVNALCDIDGYTMLRVPGNNGYNRYEIYSLANNNQTLQHPSLMQSWLSGLPCLPEQDWALSEILAGIPEIFPETTEQFLPHYIGLPQLGAISFTKGCYIGQEIIARMEYRSKDKKYHLSFLQLKIDSPDDILKPGEILPDKISVCICSALLPSDQSQMYTLIQSPYSS
jgi:folate-binding protein YgfZ